MSRSFLRGDLEQQIAHGNHADFLSARERRRGAHAPRLAADRRPADRVRSLEHLTLGAYPLLDAARGRTTARAQRETTHEQDKRDARDRENGREIPRDAESGD